MASRKFVSGSCAHRSESLGVELQVPGTTNGHGGTSPAAIQQFQRLPGKCHPGSEGGCVSSIPRGCGRYVTMRETARGIPSRGRRLTCQLNAAIGSTLTCASGSAGWSTYVVTGAAAGDASLALARLALAAR